MWVAREDELLAGTGEGDVEFAVDEMAALLEGIGSQKRELVLSLDGERIDDDIALRPLVALHSIDADVFKFWQSQLFYLLTYQGYLVAIGHDDAHCLIGIESLSVEAMDASYHVGHDVRLTDVHLVTYLWLLAVCRGQEQQPVGFEQIIGSVL